MEVTEFVTMRKAATLAKVAYPTLKKWHYVGVRGLKLPAEKIGGNVRVSTADLTKFLDDLAAIKAENTRRRLESRQQNALAGQAQPERAGA